MSRHPADRHTGGPGANDTGFSLTSRSHRRRRRSELHRSASSSKSSSSSKTTEKPHEATVDTDVPVGDISQMSRRRSRLIHAPIKVDSRTSSAAYHPESSLLAARATEAVPEPSAAARRGSQAPGHQAVGAARLQPAPASSEVPVDSVAHPATTIVSRSSDKPTTAAGMEPCTTGPTAEEKIPVIDRRRWGRHLRHLPAPTGVAEHTGSLTGISTSDGRGPLYTSANLQAGLENLLTAPHESATAKETTVRLDWAAIPAGRLLLAAVVILLLTLYLIWPTNGGKAGDKTCKTVGCIHHAVLLNINSSRSPSACEDFSVFVCSGWEGEHVHVAETVAAQTLINWFLSLQKMSLSGGYEKEAVLNRPLTAMRECLDRSGGDNDAVESLVAFVNSTDFAWPAEGEAEVEIVTYARPLRVILELAVLWALPLWFRVKLLPVNTSLHRNRAVVISPSALPVIWGDLHSQITRYDDVYPIYLSVYSSILKHRRPSRRYQSFLHASATIQGDVFRNFTSHVHNLLSSPRLVELRSLPTFVRKLAVEDWVNSLQSIYRPRSAITAQDILLATHEDILIALDTLMAGYTAEQLYFQTIWGFTQSVGGLVSNNLFSALNVYDVGRYFTRSVCFEHLDTTYNVLIASLIKAQYTFEEQTSVLTLLENVRTVALEKLRSSSKINSTLKNALAALLDGMLTVIWPEDDFGSPGGFERYYGQDYNGTGGFFGEWYWSRLQLQHALSDEDRQVDVAKVYALDTKTLISYNPALNVMSVSVSALAPPFFYNSGTSAMTYGGLGYAYAKAIFEALDTMTHLLNGGAVIQPSDAPETAAFWNASWCANAGLNHWLFPQSPALNVAYETYVRFRDLSSDMPLDGLRNYSPEQVFFFTFCHVSCYVKYLPQRSGKVSEQCHSAVQNIDAFSKAFSCPPGSGMNHENKCYYA